MYFFIGTKAELIKVVPVMKELLDRGMDFKIIASGQNDIQKTEMLRWLERKETDLSLSDKKINQSAISLFLWFLRTLPKGVWVLRKELKKADRNNALMIVHGDTISTVMGAGIARICGMRVAHIEAGLRSFSLLHPFPEEIDRILVSHLADIHFCPYALAIDNIKKRKGIKVNTFYNTLIDSLAFALSQNTTSNLLKRIKNSEYFILVVHRQENLINRGLLEVLMKTLSNLPEELTCVFIMHEPTRVALEKMNILNRLKTKKNIIITPRMPFTEFIKLLCCCEFIITDGGSNQEESSYLGKPCLVLRKVTERVEGRSANMVLSMNDPKIIESFILNYTEYVRPIVVPDISPSKVIADYLSENQSEGRCSD
jgi:UDP-N-acetylglucosamine 2-epimerase (non-hydrolysing)